MPIPSNLTNLIPSDDPQGFMRRIEAIEADVRRVPALVQSMVGPQIASIQAAQADLAAQLASINALIGAQVSPWADNASQTTTVTTTATNYATISIPVPSGFTRAAVVAISTSSIPSSQTDEIATYINGAVGPVLDIFSNEGSTSYGVVLTGLSEGSIAVATRARNLFGGSGSRVMNTSALAIFLR